MPTLALGRCKFWLVIFPNPNKALENALEMQRTLFGYNVDKSLFEQVLVCIGLGFGPVLRIGDRDVYGNEVNAASK